jgi:hypothetical protein
MGQVTALGRCSIKPVFNSQDGCEDYSLFCRRCHKARAIIHQTIMRATRIGVARM